MPKLRFDGDHEEKEMTTKGKEVVGEKARKRRSNQE